MFASEHNGVTPDIMTMAKSLGGIDYPLAGVLYNEKLDTVEPGGHMGTFRGYLVAMAAGAAAIDFMLENNLMEHAARLLEGLRPLQEEIEQIGEVRGKGLFIAAELVKDRKTKEPFPSW